MNWTVLQVVGKEEWICNCLCEPCLIIDIVKNGYLLLLKNWEVVWETRMKWAFLSSFLNLTFSWLSLLTREIQHRGLEKCQFLRQLFPPRLTDLLILRNLHQISVWIVRRQMFPWCLEFLWFESHYFFRDILLCDHYYQFVLVWKHIVIMTDDFNLTMILGGVGVHGQG